MPRSTLSPASCAEPDQPLAQNRSRRLGVSRARRRGTLTLGLTAAVAIALAGCTTANASNPTPPPASDVPTGLRIATLLPVSGALKPLLPGVQAGIGQALVDIDSAGGVLGMPVEVMQESDEGDVLDNGTVDRAADEILKSGASVVIGPMGSSRAVRIVHRITEAGMVLLSPSASDVVLSGINPSFFRLGATDTELGGALAATITQNGGSHVAFLTMKDRYGFGLRNATQHALEAAGVTTVYGGTGTHVEFPLDQSKFQTEVTAVRASGADAIVVITYDQLENVATELVKQGVDMSTVYLVDGNTNDFSETQKVGTFTGAHGMITGAPIDGEFQDQLRAVYQKMYGKELRTFSYAAESYDLVMLAALAAEQAGATDAASVQAHLAAVSGATGGEPCDTFTSCRALLKQGKEIRYAGKSGAGPLTATNEPSSVVIGRYLFNQKNVPIFQPPSIEVPARG